MMFWSKVHILKLLTFYNYDKNFYHAIKCPLTLVLKLHESKNKHYRKQNRKTNINNKVRAIEQIFVLQPVK